MEALWFDYRDSMKSQVRFNLSTRYTTNTSDAYLDIPYVQGSRDDLGVLVVLAVMKILKVP